MITSSSISYISQVLEEPQNITEADSESIQELIKTYPYFTPARYMEAALQHKEEPFAPDMLSRMQLFSGNWLLYNEFLQDSINGAEVPFETAAETVAAATITEQQPETVEEEREAIEEEEQIADIAATEEPIEEDVPVAAEQEEDIYEEEEAPVNTGFIRGKKKETAPAPPVAAEEPEVPEPEQEQQEEAPITEEPVAEEEPGVPEATQEAEPIVEEEAPAAEPENNGKKENLIPPVYTEDYFLHQGVHVSNDIPDDLGKGDSELTIPDGEQSLMIVMSFSEWLMYYKKKKQQEQEEEEDQRALKSMWQKEKLAAALEEENEEIPENVFEMAVNSITKEENLASEALAEVMVKQGRYDRAIDMYKKLSLRKPQKKAYFARKIEEILKEQ